jgi:hypothetical protein
MDLKDFDDLVNLGRVQHSVKLLNREIVLCTLNSTEYADAMTRVPQGGSALDSDRLEAMQREIVAAAIRTIDGKELSQSDKITLVSKGQLALSNLLYSEYVSMIDEQGKILEDARKNSSRETQPSKSSQAVPALT